MMKLYLVVIGAILQFSQAKVLPGKLEELLCQRWDPNYAECALESLNKSRPLFIKGIPELGLPGADPFEMPLMTVDRSINELVNIKAVLSNIKMTGAKDTIIEYFKPDPEKLTGEIRLNIPNCHLQMNYDVAGQLLIIPLRSKGFFDGNFTDTQIHSKGSLKIIEKDGEQYFKVNKLQMKMRVGDGHVELTAKNPQLQFGADLIANFYNENPRLVMDAVNPIFVETSTELLRTILDDVFSRVPAKEWFAE